VASFPCLTNLRCQTGTALGIKGIPDTLEEMIVIWEERIAKDMKYSEVNESVLHITSFHFSPASHLDSHVATTNRFISNKMAEPVLLKIPKFTWPVVRQVLSALLPPVLSKVRFLLAPNFRVKPLTCINQAVGLPTPHWLLPSVLSAALKARAQFARYCLPPYNHRRSPLKALPNGYCVPLWKLYGGNYYMETGYRTQDVGPAGPLWL